MVALVVGSTERRGSRGSSGRLERKSRWTGNGPEDVEAGPEVEPDLTLTLSPEDAKLVAQGELAPSVAYMQGRLKTDGNNALLLRVLRWTAAPASQAALKSWVESTDLRTQVDAASPPAHASVGGRGAPKTRLR
jgi:SCP-2 sterol transfer family